MENYYELLDIDTSSTNREIKRAYRKKVVKYNNNNEMTDNEKNYIKKLKKGLYILLDTNLRKLYNKKLFNKKNDKTPIDHHDFQKYDDNKNKVIHDRIFGLQELYNLKPKNIENENEFLSNVRLNSKQNI
tara:strand:+ start:3176 stop:3565 length:390 start_codon:yes stop_codon:yes gene_type:complete